MSIMESKQQQPLDVTGPNPAEAAALYGSTVNGKNSEIAEAEIEVSPLATPENVGRVGLPEYRPMSDEMTFSQAFAAARAEMGPGGTFSWRGQVYGTYYRNEWDAMTADDKHSFTLAALDARSSFETGAEPLMAEVEFDDVSDVAVVGDVNGDTIVDSDSAFLVDLVDFDEDPMASVDFSGLDV